MSHASDFYVEAVKLDHDGELEVWVHDMTSEGSPVVFTCKVDNAEGLSLDFLSSGSAYVNAIGEALKIFLDNLYCR